jgi:hypothetical protein
VVADAGQGVFVDLQEQAGGRTLGTVPDQLPSSSAISAESPNA